LPRDLQRLVSASSDVIFVIDARNRRVIFVNHEEPWGYQRATLADQAAILALVYEDDQPAVLAHMRSLDVSGGDAVTHSAIDYRLWHRNGQVEWIHSRASVLRHGDDARPQQILFVLTPITARKNTEQMLDYQTHYDVVTGLPNRFLFSDRLDQEINAARAAAASFALCVIDLDRFNQINDTLGHTAGDEVLAFVALRLRSMMGTQALLARMGGDEFTLIMRQVRDPDEAISRARAILTILEQPFPLQSQEIFISASIGISLFPRDGQDVTTLLKHADSALHRVKAIGRNGVSLFDPALGAAARRRLDLEQQMRRAIDLEQFELHYQPMIDMRSQTVVAVESLIRWSHPDQGLIMPDDFIALAEEANLMERLFSWGIAEACRQAVAWQRAGLPPMRIAVNISARQFERDDIVARVAGVLRSSGLDARWLELEITEGMLMRDPEGSAVRIQQLHALGVRVALDDFGTGYSSLAYLQRFPVERLKIDRSFVWALGAEPDHESNAAALLRAITAMAHSLRLRVVAEGVESLGQHQLLAGLGCEEAQGFLYARPMRADALIDVITRLNSR
jgi:diguanylate cyclase (GGDEF)-like protein/PAS domain S-box-containing protein